MKIIFLVTMIALICSGAVFAAEEITLSTFYPAPYGEYDELGVDSMAVGSGYAIPAGDGDMVVQGNVGIGTTALGAYQLNVNGTFNCAALSYTGGVLISSDERLKTNIYNLESVSDRIMRLRGVHFNWKDSNRDKEDGLQIGFIAQELEKEFPELVMENNEGIKYVRYGNFTAVLLEAFKEQQSQIEDLQAKVENLESKVK
ncbi:MAG: tail fiber domain-containing protein [Candidatus Orphnella occulta]|nr:tail fiber domain-containing protein [Candidatus Orphnella occulta]